MQWPKLVMPVVYFSKNDDTARTPPSARMRFILFVFTFKTPLLELRLPLHSHAT
jgi:hypothetical protein